MLSSWFALCCMIELCYMECVRGERVWDHVGVSSTDRVWGLPVTKDGRKYSATLRRQGAFRMQRAED